MTSVLTLVLFAVGAGIFATLSAAERRVWPLMWNGHAAEDDIRAVQRLLVLVVDVLPPAMMVIVFGSGVLIARQAVTGMLGSWTWPIVVTYGVFLVAILHALFPTIRAVKGLDMEKGPIDRVRAVTKDRVLVRHLGFGLTVMLMPMLAAIVVGS